MDLEKLNTSQVVLLTLLTSFVTSIATGIVTVSLMEDAPPAITQTVNRVVERTIEKVAPQASVAAAAGAIAPEPTVIRESDLVAQAVARISPSVVRLFAPGKDETGRDIRLFVGLAVVTDAKGILVADVGTPDSGLTALRTDGVEVPVTVIARPKGVNLVRLQAATTTGDTKESVAWKPVTFTEKQFDLGRTIITLGGRTSPRVAQGIVTGVPETEKEGSAPIVETSIALDAYAAGSPVFDTDGAIVGIATRESRAIAGGFLATSGMVLQNIDTKEGETAPAASN